MDGSGERWDCAGIVGAAEITHNPNAFWKSLSDNRLTRLALALRSTLLRASSGATTTQTHARERVRSFPHRMLTAGTGCVRAEARLTPAGSKMFAVVAARASRKVVSRSITARWTARGALGFSPIVSSVLSHVAAVREFGAMPHAHRWARPSFVIARAALFAMHCRIPESSRRDVDR